MERVGRLSGWELAKREVECVALELFTLYGPEAWEWIEEAVEEIAEACNLEEEEVEQLKAYARRVLRREEEP